MKRKGKINFTVLEIRRFPCPCNQEKEFSLACLLTTNQKEGRMHDFRFLRGRGRFLKPSWLAALPSLLSFFLYPRKP